MDVHLDLKGIRALHVLLLAMHYEIAAVEPLFYAQLYIRICSPYKER